MKWNWLETNKTRCLFASANCNNQIILQVDPAWTIRYSLPYPIRTSTVTSSPTRASLRTWKLDARVSRKPELHACMFINVLIQMFYIIYWQAGTIATLMDVRPRFFAPMAHSSLRRSSSATGGSMYAAISPPGCMRSMRVSISAPRWIQRDHIASLPSSWSKIYLLELHTLLIDFI